MHMFKRKAGSLISAVLAACMTAVIFALLMLVMRLYPFGDNTLLYGEGGRYLSVLGNIQEIAAHPDSLFYSWHSAMGTNMAEISAAFLFSPLNYLLLLFPDNLLLGFHIIAGLRLSLASFAFCIWLNRKPGLHVFSRAILGVAYAYTGFMMQYLTGASIADGAVFLPLLAVGVERIYEGKGILFYVLALALAVLTGYRMIAVFFLASVLLYFRGIFDTPGVGVRLKRTIVPWIAGTLISLGICAIVLIPVFLITHPGYQMRMPEFMVMHGDPAVLLRSLMSGYKPEADAPLLFIGMVPLVLALMWFFDGEITLRHKIVTLIMLALAVMTFWLPIPYLFRMNVEAGAFDVRCTYLVVFILMDLAAESRGSLESMSRTGYILSAVTAVMLFAGSVLVHSADWNLWTAVIDAVLIIASLVCAYLITSGNKRTAALALSVLTLFNLSENAWLTLHETVKEKSAAQFYDDYDKVTGALSQIPDSGMYRAAQTFSWGKNDAFLYGYHAADGYLSGSQFENTGPAYANFLGVAWDNDHSSYAEAAQNIPETSDSMMSVKYLIAKEEPEEKDYQKVSSYSGLLIYENPYALPVFTAVGDLPENDQSDPFVSMNMRFRSLSGSGDDIFTALKTSSSSKGNDIVLSFTGNGKPLYLYLPGKAEVTAADTVEKTEFSADESERIYCLGTKSSGRRVTVTISPDASSDADFGRACIYAEDRSALKKLSGMIQKNAVAVEKVTPSHLKGTCSIPAGTGYIVTTVPYSGGWNITVDGRTSIAGSDSWGMLSFGITEGTHTIEMVYRPQGYITGMIVSAVSVILLVVFMLIHTGRIYRYRKEDKEQERLKKEAELLAQQKAEEEAKAAEEAAKQEVEAQTEPGPALPEEAAPASETIPSEIPEETADVQEESGTPEEQ